MTLLPSSLSSLFRPADRDLSEEKQTSVQLHRLLTLIGASGLLLIGAAHWRLNPKAVDPRWARLGVTALFVGLLAGSYCSKWLRQNYERLLQAFICVGLAWLAAVVALNDLSPGYALGFLLAYGTLLLVVGLGAETIRPVLWFAGYGLSLGFIAGLWADPQPNVFAVLLLSLAAMALVGAVVIGRLLSVREQLKKRGRRLRSITENVSEGIYRSTPEEGLIYANQAFAEMFGYESAEEALQADPEDFYANPDERERHREEAKRQGNFEGLEVQFERKDGSTFTGLLSGTVVRGESGEVQYYDGAITNITARIKREERLAEAKREAEKANRTKSVFLANMSHEIRTPLTTILGFAEVIGDEVGEDSDGRVPRFARLIEESGTALLETLDAVLNLSRLEAGEVELTPEPVRLREVAREIGEVHRPEAEEAGIELKVQADPSAQALADEGGLTVALRNLVSNAVKYTGEGGTVWVRAREETESALLEVEDTGIGMCPETAGELFEPFRQASEGTGREYQGTGLGLAVTRRMVRQMGGSIAVETEEGEGSCFRISLPKPEGSGLEEQTE